MNIKTTTLQLVAFLIGISIGTLEAQATTTKVKQSNSGICHDEGSPWYEKTKTFTAFGSMSECLTSGRAYKGYTATTNSKTDMSQVSGGSGVSVDAKTPYDRHLYDHWIDVDGDCQNARHELLQDLSTGPVTLSKSGCTVIHGRWNDPYTGQIFSEARDLDIDHMVPLAWAHAHGADLWDADLRRQFANDPINLFAVQASANRAKGAQGPLEWLPPAKNFQCSYVTRFHRIVLTYNLEYSDWEQLQMDQLREKLCGQ